MIINLRFKFQRRQELNDILAKVKFIQQEAVNWLIANGKTTVSSAHFALYHPFRQLFPYLNSQWLISALKTVTEIVRFNKRKVKRSSFKKPFVSLSPYLFGMRGESNGADGIWLPSLWSS